MDIKRQVGLAYVTMTTIGIYRAPRQQVNGKTLENAPVRHTQREAKAYATKINTGYISYPKQIYPIAHKTGMGTCFVLQIYFSYSQEEAR